MFASTYSLARRLALTVVVGSFTILLAPAAHPEDWTRWLGPQQTGASTETGIFGKGTPKLEIAWNRPLGVAYSGIAVTDGRAVTMFGDGETDWLIALDASSGEEIWRYRVDEMFPKIGGADGGQLSMPVIADGVVYGFGARGQVFAVELSDGSEIWSVRADERLGAIRPHFGFTSSPLVVGDLLFVQTGGDEGNSLTGLDRKTGKKRWSVGDDKVGYQSPILATLAGVEQIVAVTNHAVSGLNPKDGRLLWSLDHGLNERDGWSTPILIGEDRFVLTARNESAAYAVAKSGGELTIEQTWRGSRLKGNFAMPVAYEGHVYGYDGDFLACVEAGSGTQLWKERADAAGLVLVDGHLVLYATDGTIVVAEASPAGFEPKTSLQVSERSGFTFPSFSDGGIYVRNLETIARIDVR